MIGIISINSYIGIDTMYLKKLEIHGFKSFAHKTVLEFDPGLTAIVGPNGSGKSNVADSIRWVMGEQSLKLLRGKKSEDVIFAGSDKKSKLSVAEVSLTFDNRDRKLPLEYLEVVMTRRIYRNGESEFLINNQRTRLLDIVDALVRSGFGAANYTVIGQGTIDQLVMAGPAEIKQLVEEASGVKPYYLKREKTLRRLNQTEENVSKVTALLAEIEPRLRSLRRQAKRMEERERIAGELVGFQLTYFGHQFYLIETEVSAITDQLGLRDKDIQILSKEIGEFQAILEKEERQNRGNANFAEEIENKLSALESKRFLLAEQLAEIRGKLKAGLVPGKMDAENVKIQKLDWQRQIDLLKEKVKNNILELNSDGKYYQSLKSNLEKASAQIEMAKENRIDSNKLRQSLVQFEQDFIQVLEQIQSNNVADISARLKHLVSEFVRSQQTAGANQIDISKLVSQKDEITAELHALELRLVERRTLRDSFQEQLDNLVIRLDQLRSLDLGSSGDFKNELFTQEAQATKQLAEINNHLQEQQGLIKKYRDNDRDKKSFLMTEERKYREKSLKLSQLKDEQSKLLIEKAKLDTRLQGLNHEASESLGNRFSELAQHKGGNIDPDLPNRITRLKRQLELAGGVDESTLQEYRETQERFDYLSSQSKDLTKAVTDLKNVIVELDEIIKKQFNQAFTTISEKFEQYFRILFNGGRATMTLLKESAEVNDSANDNEEDEEEEDKDENKVSIDAVGIKKPRQEIVGIEIRATPPGKKLSAIASLSGGERALTAIALLCSMLSAYPSPFVVLDEVDAALDEANSIRFAKILGTLVASTQFITITHNRETMRQAHTLYGVTMSDEGISKILSIKLDTAEKIAE